VLAPALLRAGYTLVGVASRGDSARRLAGEIGVARVEPADLGAADLVLIAVPDDQVASAAATVRWRAGSTAAHLSGALPAAALEEAVPAGVALGSFHPLQSFAGPRSLKGVTFGIEAADDTFELLRQIALDLGGTAIRLGAAQKAAYHLGGALVSNLTVALAWAATGLWVDSGISAGRDEALRALAPLLEGTLANLRERGLPEALTGPAARGDAGTIAHHVALLHRGDHPEVTAAYRELTRIALEAAAAKGLPAERVRAVRDALGTDLTAA